MLKRVGIYAWAGPGTERILRIKYFSPEIDHESLSNAYDYEYLAKLQDLFDITDAWISYSWGFSKKHEEEDYKFTLDHLANFKKLGIKTHAYLQGCNLVYKDFSSSDFWCRDEKNRLVTYYKGRKVTCANNPGFRKFFQSRIKEMLVHPFEGIFVDNIQMGQLGIPMPNNQLPFVFTGCKCQYCGQKFKNLSGESIPSDLEFDTDLTKKYLDFRADSIENFVAETSKAVHAAHKLFGTNSYDPKFNSKNLYGFDIYKLQKYQDYMLFENHALNEKCVDNSYINKLKLKKPVFVVSYKKGIGFEKQYSQKDFDLIFSESSTSNFFPLLKTSEYTTNGIWHNLRLNKLNKPNKRLSIISPSKIKQRSILLNLLSNRLFRSFIKANYNPIYTLVMENKYVRPLMNVIYELILH